jgi:hypothetical protein
VFPSVKNRDEIVVFGGVLLRAKIIHKLVLFGVGSVIIISFVQKVVV